MQMKLIENSISIVLKILIAFQDNDENDVNLDQKWLILNMKQIDVNVNWSVIVFQIVDDDDASFNQKQSI